MEEGITSLSLTQKRQHEKKMGASVRSIKANVPAFIPSKSSQPTFVFDKCNVNSDDETVDEENEQANNGNNNDDNNVMNEDSFYGMTI